MKGTTSHSAAGALIACVESLRLRVTRNSGHGCEKEKPIVSMDYAFLGIQKGKDKDEQMKLEDEAAKACMTRSPRPCSPTWSRGA